MGDTSQCIITQQKHLFLTLAFIEIKNVIAFIFFFLSYYFQTTIVGLSRKMLYKLVFANFIWKSV